MPTDIEEDFVDETQDIYEMADAVLGVAVDVVCALAVAAVVLFAGIGLAWWLA